MMLQQAKDAMEAFRLDHPKCFTNGWFSYPDDSPEAVEYSKWMHQALDNKWSSMPENPEPPCIDIFTND